MARSSFQWLYYNHLFTQRREPISSEAINQRTSPSPRMRLMRGSGADELKKMVREISGEEGRNRRMALPGLCINYSTVSFISPVNLICPRARVHHLQCDLPPLKTNFLEQIQRRIVPPFQPSLVFLVPHAAPFYNSNLDLDNHQA